MALTPAEKQKHYRQRLKAADQTNPDTIERALLQEVERFERGELSEEERIALADRCADQAMDSFHRMNRLNRMAMRLNPGGAPQRMNRRHPGDPL